LLMLQAGMTFKILKFVLTSLHIYKQGNELDSIWKHELHIADERIATRARETRPWNRFTERMG
jgi:hypothetical protein